MEPYTVLEGESVFVGLYPVVGEPDEVDCDVKDGAAEDDATEYGAAADGAVEDGAAEDGATEGDATADGVLEYSAAEDGSDVAVDNEAEDWTERGAEGVSDAEDKGAATMFPWP